MLIMAHATPRHITANYNPMGVRTTSLNIQNTQKYKKKMQGNERTNTTSARRARTRTRTHTHADELKRLQFRYLGFQSYQW